MSTPSPLVPQGTQKPRVQSNIRIAVFTILAIHAVLFSGLLMQGCKPEPTKQAGDQPPSLENMLSGNPGPAVTPGTGPADTQPVPPLPLPVGVNVPGAPVQPAPAPAPQVANAPALPPIPGAPAAPGDYAPMVAAPVGAAAEHTIAKGEMIATIAKKYGVTSAAILAANPGLDPKRLQINKKIQIPAPQPKSESAAVRGAASASDSANVYTVKSGDNLTKIAKQLGTSILEIRRANSLKTDRLSVGQKLKVPSKIATAPAAPAPSASTAPASGSTSVAALR